MGDSRFKRYCTRLIDILVMQWSPNNAYICIFFLEFCELRPGLIGWCVINLGNDNDDDGDDVEDDDDDDDIEDDNDDDDDDDDLENDDDDDDDDASYAT